MYHLCSRDSSAHNFLEHLITTSITTSINNSTMVRSFNPKKETAEEKKLRKEEEKLRKEEKKKQQRKVYNVHANDA